ncbi:MAG: hypothetical protein RR272_00920 [Synergistaceae bacterium]
MFTLVYGAFLFTMVIFIAFIVCFVSAFIFSRIGAKFKIGSFIEFLIPIYNVMLLCDCAKVTRWLTLCILAPGVVVFAVNAISLFSIIPFRIDLCSNVIALVACAYLWGRIAKRLGKNFYLWGIGTVVFMGIPTLIMAFDNSKVEE